MLSAVKSEYLRRGSPMQAVGWKVATMCRFMRAKIATSAPGDDLGTYNYELPEKSEKKQPPPLPDWVLKHEESNRDEESEEPDMESDKEENDEEEALPANGWAVLTENVKGKKTHILAHKKTNKKVDIGPPESQANWVIFSDAESEEQFPGIFWLPN